MSRSFLTIIISIFHVSGVSQVSNADIKNFEIQKHKEIPVFTAMINEAIPVLIISNNDSIKAYLLDSSIPLVSKDFNSYLEIKQINIDTSLFLSRSSIDGFLDDVHHKSEIAAMLAQSNDMSENSILIESQLEKQAGLIKSFLRERNKYQQGSIANSILIDENDVGFAEEAKRKISMDENLVDDEKWSSSIVDTSSTDRVLNLEPRSNQSSEEVNSRKGDLTLKESPGKLNNQRDHITLEVGSHSVPISFESGGNLDKISSQNKPLSAINLRLEEEPLKEKLPESILSDSNLQNETVNEEVQSSVKEGVEDHLFTSNSVLEEAKNYDRTFEGITFHLQIAALSVKKNNKDVGRSLSISSSVNNILQDGLYKYYIGNFSTYLQAKKRKEKLRSEGIESFIIAKSGTRIIDLKSLLLRE